jgi:site-specific DNA-adenine methylase
VFNQIHKTNINPNIDGLFGSGDFISRRREVRREIVAQSGLEKFESLQHLHNTERLGQVLAVPRIDKLILHNGGYDEVEVKDDGVIYLDPPYKGTKKYQHDINHGELDEWIRSQKVPVYVSSYEWEGLEVVEEFDHRGLMSAKENQSVTEKLFVWRP